MELVTHYSRSFRRTYDRSISEQKFENHHLREDIFKGHNQNLKDSEFHSYHQRQGKKMLIIFFVFTSLPYH